MLGVFAVTVHLKTKQKHSEKKTGKPSVVMVQITESRFELKVSFQAQSFGRFFTVLKKGNMHKTQSWIQ